MPVTKVWTAGVQVVNGWNNVTDNNGGVTIGLTSSLVKPKYTWNTNYYVGPENSGITKPPTTTPAGTQKGYRNLIDTTLLLTPNAKFNMPMSTTTTPRTTLPAPLRCTDCEESFAAKADVAARGRVLLFGSWTDQRQRGTGWPV
jgi:hypothetical protein